MTPEGSLASSSRKFRKVGTRAKRGIWGGVERKEGGACFKGIKVNFTNVDKRRFTNKPNCEISRGVLQNRGVCGRFPLLSSPPLFFFFFFLFLSVTGELSTLTMGEYCLVPRPHFSSRPKRFGSRGPCENVRAFPTRSPRIRHRNELTERDWENAVHGLGGL